MSQTQLKNKIKEDIVDEIWCQRKNKNQANFNWSKLIEFIISLMKIRQENVLRKKKYQSKLFFAEIKLVKKILVKILVKNIC